MSENEKREMLEKEAAVFEQELSDKEMEHVAGGTGLEFDEQSRKDNDDGRNPQDEVAFCPLNSVRKNEVAFCPLNSVREKE